MTERSKLKVGVVVDCLCLPIHEAVMKAANMGAEGIQVWVTSGEMLAANMDSAKRKDFVKLCKDHGLAITGLCVEFGPSLRVPAEAAEVVPKVKAGMDQAVDLGAPMVSAHMGGITADANDPNRDHLRRVLKDIGDYGSKCGVVFATETVGESGATLRAALDSLDTDGIKVNFDPANLVMNGFDHMQAVRDLAPYVVHTHAKDGRKGVGELPLGQGDVNYPAYVTLWRSLGYEGFFTVEREVGEDRVGDIGRAVELLRTL